MDTELKHWQSSSSSEDQAEDTGKKRNMKKEQKRVSALRRERQRNLPAKKEVSNQISWKTLLADWFAGCFRLQLHVSILWLSVMKAAAAMWSRTSLSVWRSWKLLAKSLWCDTVAGLSPGVSCFTSLPVWADTGGAAGLWWMTQWYLMSHASSICEDWAERCFELIANVPDDNANVLLFYIMCMLGILV